MLITLQEKTFLGHRIRRAVCYQRILREAWVGLKQNQKNRNDN